MWDWEFSCWFLSFYNSILLHRRRLAFPTKEAMKSVSTPPSPGAKDIIDRSWIPEWPGNNKKLDTSVARWGSTDLSPGKNVPSTPEATCARCWLSNYYTLGLFLDVNLNFFRLIFVMYFHALLTACRESSYITLLTTPRRPSNHTVVDTSM